MKLEKESARSAIRKIAAPLAFVSILAITATAPDALAAIAAILPSPARKAVTAAPWGFAVVLEEQNLPPQELPSPAPSPAASATADSVDREGLDRAGTGASFPLTPAAATQTSSQSSTDASDQGGAQGWTRVPVQSDGASQNDSAMSGSSQAAPGATASPMPEASPTEAPPPYDVGSVQPTPPVSDQALTGLIDSTKDQPALNASLHFAEQGRQALEASRLDDAIRHLGRAVSIDPTDPYAYFYLGRVYMAKKDYAQALAFFGRSEVGLRSMPAWLGEVKGFEGACLEEQGKFAAAAAAYKQALDVSPGNLMARTGYGRLSQSMSDANAGNAPPPPAPVDGAALPAPEINMAAPPPIQDAAPPAEPGDSNADGSEDR